jgi:hypothetical protein
VLEADARQSLEVNVFIGLAFTSQAGLSEGKQTYRPVSKASSICIFIEHKREHEAVFLVVFDLPINELRVT